MTRVNVKNKYGNRLKLGYPSIYDKINAISADSVFSQLKSNDIFLTSP